MKEIESKNNGFEVLSDVDHVRKRLGMYLGEADPTRLIVEIVDNALDEALNQFANKIDITIDPKTYEVRVEDNGRGIIEGKYDSPGSPFDKKEIIDLIYTKLFSSEKFRSDGIYKHSVGLHGVGGVVVNALSEYLTCEVYKKKKKSTYEFLDSNFVVKMVKKSDKKPKFTGTTITFKPSSVYFESMSYDLKIIERRLKMFKYLYPHCELIVNGEPIEVKTLSDIHSTFDSKLPVIEIEGDGYFLAFTYNFEETSFHKHGYINLLPVNEGSHIVHINSLFRDVWSELSGNSYEFDKDDCFLGLSLLFSVYLKDPQFSSQTKERLTSSKVGVKDVVEDLGEKIVKELKSRKYNNSFTKPLLMRFQDYRKSMKKLKVIDYVKEAIKYGEVENNSNGAVVSRRTTVEKLFDCNSSNREETELYVVEGQSAGGSILQCRDIKIHAVLPLRGKPLNPMNLTLDKIVGNAEFRSLINAIGTGVAPLEKVNSVRYGKIIIAADGDPDGRSIEALLLGGFLKLFPELISAGRLYVCEAPLFWQKRRGFLWNFESVDTSKPFQRFKGLGEMNADQIYESMVSPKTRRLCRIIVDDKEDRDYAFQLVSNSEVRRDMLRKENLIE